MLADVVQSSGNSLETCEFEKDGARCSKMLEDVDAVFKGVVTCCYRFTWF